MTREPDLGPEVLRRLENLEHQAELIKTVLMVKEPGSVQAAQTYEGLRKQVIAGAAERRSHLVQLVTMSVAVSRASSIEDLRPLVREWMEQAGIQQIRDVPDGFAVSDLFEDLDGGGLAGAFECVEPAYLDTQTKSPIRLGRARSKPYTDDGAPAGGAS